MSVPAVSPRRSNTEASKTSAVAGPGKPPPRIATAVVLEGFLDVIEARRVYGWVRNPDNIRERCSVAVRCGDVVLGTVLANRERRDLKEAGIGDGRYAFQFDFEPPLEEAAREQVVAEAFCEDQSASLTLERFDRRPAVAGGASGEIDSLKLALGRIAANQIRSFTQQSSTMEAISLRLGDLDRRTDTRARIGASAADEADIEERLAALEGMHLRFERALIRLSEEHGRLSRAEASSAARRVRITVLAAVILGLIVGLVTQWQFGLFGR